MPWSLQMALSEQLGSAWLRLPRILESRAVFGFFPLTFRKRSQALALRRTRMLSWRLCSRRPAGGPCNVFALILRDGDDFEDQDGYTLSYASTQLRADREVVTQVELLIAENFLRAV